MALNTTAHTPFHDKYAVVPADSMAPNNIVFVCKSHYIDSLIKELTIHLVNINISTL